MLFKQLGVTELLIILVIVVLVFGVGRLGKLGKDLGEGIRCLLYTSPSPRDRTRSRMPSSA